MGTGELMASGFTLLLMLWLNSSSPDLRPPQMPSHGPIPKLDKSITSGHQEVGMVPLRRWLRPRTEFRVKLGSERLCREDQPPRKALCLQYWASKSYLGYGWGFGHCEGSVLVAVVQKCCVMEMQYQVMVWAVELVPGGEHKEEVSHVPAPPVKSFGTADFDLAKCLG